MLPCGRVGAGSMVYFTHKGALKQVRSQSGVGEEYV